MRPDILAEVRGLVIEAGKKIMPFCKGQANVSLKQDNSPLTAADLAAHHFLVDSLPSILPGVPVVSEESSAAVHSSVSQHGLFWLVDPLDGTKEFLKGTGEFTVNVALVEDGRPVLGVVHAPVLMISYYASKADGGSWRQEGKDAPIRLKTRRAELSRISVVASKDHAGPMVQAMLERLTNPTLRSMGSSLKFCLVAEGAADIYLRDVPTMEWDTAAAQCVVEMAGGAVCTLDGKTLRYGKAGLENPALMTSGDLNFDWRQFTCGDRIRP